MKLLGDPNSVATIHWRGEVRRFLIDSKRSYPPGTRRLIELDVLWRDAIDLAYASLRDNGLATLRSLPENCPFSLDELLPKKFDVKAATARLRALSG